MRSKYDQEIGRIVEQALKEDIGQGDVTTSFVVDNKTLRKAVISAQEPGIICGIGIVKAVFWQIDRKLLVKAFKEDGDEVLPGEKIVAISGKAASILTGERVALNFLSFLSGIASYTGKVTHRIANTRVKIMDTRKTAPTLRILEKYAVKSGGGENHRYGLWDGIIIKDNHLKASGIIKNGKVDEKRLNNLILALRKRTSFPIEIEVENISEFKKIIKYMPDVIMLDNFKPASIVKAVKYRNSYFPEVKLESSGGIKLANVKTIAETGVDFISMGAITHSFSALDFSLEITDE